MLKNLLLMLALCLPCQCIAQSEPPAKPQPIVTVRLTDGQSKWYAPLLVKEKTADSKWIASVALSALMTVADGENSVIANNCVAYTVPRKIILARSPLSSPVAPVAGRACEINPVFGNPFSRNRYYAVALPVLAFTSWESYRYKREDDALRAAGLPEHKYSKWWLPNALNGGAHVIAVLITLASTGR